MYIVGIVNIESRIGENIQAVFDLRKDTDMMKLQDNIYYSLHRYSEFDSKGHV